MPASTRSRSTKKKPRKAAPRLNYAQLRKLAPKMKPPQSWYDQTDNAFEPEAQRKAD